MTARLHQADEAKAVGFDAETRDPNHVERASRQRKMAAKGLEPHEQKVVGYRRGYRLTTSKKYDCISTH